MNGLGVPVEPDGNLAGGRHGRLGLERKLAYFLQPPGGYEPETSVLYLS